jgi:hypothetical protein
MISNIVGGIAFLTGFKIPVSHGTEGDSKEPDDTRSSGKRASFIGSTLMGT